MSGTDRGYAATSRVLWEWRQPSLLLQVFRYQPTRPYALSGTDVVYAPTAPAGTSSRPRSVSPSHHFPTVPYPPTLPPTLGPTLSSYAQTGHVAPQRTALPACNVTIPECDVTGAAVGAYCSPTARGSKRRDFSTPSTASTWPSWTRR
eukprot:1363694-Rhodomonas_salina.2